MDLHSTNERVDDGNGNHADAALNLISADPMWRLCTKLWEIHVDNPPLPADHSLSHGVGRIWRKYDGDIYKVLYISRATRDKFVCSIANFIASLVLREYYSPAFFSPLKYDIGLRDQGREDAS